MVKLNNFKNLKKKEIYLTEFDFTREPMKLELGGQIIYRLINDENFYSRLETCIGKIRKKYETEKTNIPRFIVVDNLDLDDNEYKIVFYGKALFTETLQQIKDDFFTYTMSIFQSYIEKYKDIFAADSSNKKGKVKLIKRKNSYEAYIFLYNYYTRYENNPKQAFHWLKKASYYKVLNCALLSTQFFLLVKVVKPHPCCPG